MAPPSLMTSPTGRCVNRNCNCNGGDSGYSRAIEDDDSDCSAPGNNDLGDGDGESAVSRISSMGINCNVSDSASSPAPAAGGAEQTLDEPPPNDIYRLVTEMRWCLSELGVDPQQQQQRDLPDDDDDDGNSNNNDADSRRGRATDRAVESWACLVYESMSAPSRAFHGVGHVFDISGGAGADAILKLAAFFHDVVYYSIDGGLSPDQADVLEGVIVEEMASPGGAAVVRLSEGIADEDRHVAMVMTLFGLRPGQVLNPFLGLNEFLSAVVAVRCLRDVLEDSHLLQIAACIEATVPFRRRADEANGYKTSSDILYDNTVRADALMATNLTEEQIVQSTQRAVLLANRDIHNFATTDHAFFLANTWNLLPEANINLRHKSEYRISSFTLALRKMHGFLSNLDPAIVFRSFRGVPTEDEQWEFQCRAADVLGTAVRYLETKILGLSVIAALAELTGGDAPLAMFVRGMAVIDEDDDLDDLEDDDDDDNGLLGEGDTELDRKLAGMEKPAENRSASVKKMSYIQHFGSVTKSDASIGRDERVYQLLKEGRSRTVEPANTFHDLNNSPLAAYLYGRMGDAGCERSMEFCVCPMDSLNARRLLDSIPRSAVRVIARSCARIVLTRSQELTGIADMYSKANALESQN